MLLVMSDPVMQAVDRLRRILERSGLTPSKAGTLAGVDRSKVYDWVNEKSKPQKIADVEKVIEAAREYEATPTKKGTLIKRGKARIIKVMPGLHAGVPTRSYSDVEEIEVLDWGNDYERWGRAIEGDSMLPLLEPGDIVIFENRQHEPNHVVHAECDDREDTVKVYRRQNGENALVPTNPQFDPIKLEGQWRIKGVAIEVRRKLPNDATMIIEYPRGLRWREEKT